MNKRLAVLIAGFFTVAAFAPAIARICGKKAKTEAKK
jgi:hypothetical protein